jgi:hypothetical protein
MMLAKVGVWVSTLVVAFCVTGPAEAAFQVHIEEVSGVWTDVSPSAVDGAGTSEVSWGKPAWWWGHRSSYRFEGDAPPAQGPFGVGSSFTLGTFTHDNFPIVGDPADDLAAASLEVTVRGTVENGVTGSFSTTSVFDFRHDETPNVWWNPWKSRDIVTATTNAAQSVPFRVGGRQFIFAYSGLQVGGEIFDEFRTFENKHNSALLQASVTEVVPLPAALPLMLGGLGGVFGLARHRRHRRERAHAAG